MAKYSDIIMALAADYLNVFTVDVENNTADTVKLEGYVTDGITDKPQGFCYTDMLKVYANNRVVAEDREYLLNSVFPQELTRVFSDEKRQKYEVAYRVLEDGGIHHYLAYFARLSEFGTPLKLIVGFRNIDVIVIKQEEKRHEGLNKAYAAVSDIYLSMHRVDVISNTFTTIKTTQQILQYSIPGSDNYDENIRRILPGLAGASCTDALNFTERSTLEQRMQGKSHIFIEFMGKFSGLCRLHFLKEDEDSEGHLHHVIFAVEIIDEAKSYAIFNALSRSYHNVFLTNLYSGTSKVLKLEGYHTQELKYTESKTFSYSTVLDEYIEKWVHPDDREMLRESISLDHMRSIFAHQDEYIGNYRVMRDGELHYFQFQIFKVAGEHYVVTGFRNIDKLISEHDAAEKERREKERAYQAKLQEQLSIFDALARNFKNVYLVNIKAATAKVLKLEDEYSDNRLDDLAEIEFPYDKFLNAWIDEAVHPNDRKMLSDALCPEHLQEVFATEKEYIGNYRMLVDGKVINYQFNLSLTSTPGLVIAGFQNIEGIISAHLEEEKKQRQKEQEYQRQLVAAANEAKNANAAKTEFLLRMSHDIRTPLNGIVGMLEIADRFPNDVQKQTECRTKTKESSKVLLELINEVLDMSKLESGEVVLEHIPFNLAEISREIHSIVDRQAEERGINIVEKDYNVPHSHLIGSPMHFKRLVLNILSNAIKYNKENGSIFITALEKNFDGSTATIEFICQDTGIGMSPEFQQRIFEPFSQENASPRSKFGGTGLGMSITKSLVEKMGGTISLESVKNEGTTFVVTIPFEIDPEQGAEIELEQEAENFSIGGMNIILAEDNELNMEIAKFLLNDGGANIIEAHNGQEAVDAFANSEPGFIDVILMDVMMPVMDGYEATRQIRALNRPDAGNVPIIAMTANAFVEDKISARKAGMNEHIAKPLDPKQVVKAIAKLVCEHHTQEKSE